VKSTVCPALYFITFLETSTPDLIIKKMPLSQRELDVAHSLFILSQQAGSLAREFGKEWTLLAKFTAFFLSFIFIHSKCGLSIKMF
jgi:hypothetical protein